MPRFVELLPPPGRATLDLGCGEGRLGRILVDSGHRVTGVELQPTLARLAREHHEVVEADAAKLPFPDSSFDLVIAFMSLHDMEDMEGAVREAARVLEPGGHFCFAVEHPLQKAGSWADPDDPQSAFTITGSYFATRRDAASIDRDGLRLTLHGIYRPLEGYARALKDAGFLIEAAHEPCPTPISSPVGRGSRSGVAYRSSSHPSPEALRPAAAYICGGRRVPLVDESGSEDLARSCTKGGASPPGRGRFPQTTSGSREAV